MQPNSPHLDMIISDDAMAVMRVAYSEGRRLRLATLTPDNLLAALLSAKPINELLGLCSPGADLAGLRGALRERMADQAAHDAAHRTAGTARLQRLGSLLHLYVPFAAQLIPSRFTTEPQPSAQFEAALCKAIIPVLELQLNCRDLLVALLADADSPAAVLAEQHGIPRYAIICYLAHGAPVDADHAYAKLAEGGAQVRLVLLNDNYTPMPFVTALLESVFSVAPETALSMMMDIHQEGRVDCGAFPFETALDTLHRITALAAAQRHPLKGVLVALSRTADQGV